ncbi:MAG: hypothetical protein ABI877_02310, partial [Gemmatimonadaceae bacterium]
MAILRFTAAQTFGIERVPPGRYGERQAVTSRTLPDDVIRFIQSSVPTIDALEILLFLVNRNGTPSSPADVSTSIGGVSVTESAVSRYFDLLRSQGVVAESPAGGYAYRPASADIEQAIVSLTRAYNERPVTLIRTVYG